MLEVEHMKKIRVGRYVFNLYKFIDDLVLPLIFGAIIAYIMKLWVKKMAGM